jgi:hypothetical protein
MPSQSVVFPYLGDNAIMRSDKQKKDKKDFKDFLKDFFLSIVLPLILKELSIKNSVLIILVRQIFCLPYFIGFLMFKAFRGLLVFPDYPLHLYFFDWRSNALNANASLVSEQIT